LNSDLLKQQSQVFIHNAKVSLELNETKAIQSRLKARLKLEESLNLQTVGEKLFTSLTKIV
jgi:hypothetical protein